MFKFTSELLPPELEEQLFQDFLKFYDVENQLHHHNQEHSTEYNDSVVENIGTLNPKALNGPIGQDRIDYLFGSKSHLYATSLRIAGFTSASIIRYGDRVLQEYHRRCLLALEEYGTRREVIRKLDKKYNTFWTFPLFIRAYNYFLRLHLTLPDNSNK